ncbi:MAG: DoxX family protein [Aeromicrobium erythreum]
MVTTGLVVAAGLVLTATGLAKLLAVPAMRANADHLGFSVAAFRLIGLVELAGVVALVLGLWWTPVLVVSAAALLVLLVGAVVAHRRAGDPVAATLPAIGTGVLLLAATTLAVLS